MKRAKECLLNLSIAYPEYKLELDKISKRLTDIRSIFTEQYYYDPKFKGSLYFKKIVPVMCPEISYDSLKYKSGNDALLGYKIMVNEGQPELANHLKAYSMMDAMSLMKTFEFLQSFYLTSRR